MESSAAVEGEKVVFGEEVTCEIFDDRYVLFPCKFLTPSQSMELRTRCSWRLITDMKAYGSLSLPSTFTVEPSSGCERTKLARAERSNSGASLPNSCRSKTLIPSKSTSG